MQTAYSVLSDAQERKWYDDHREAILKGGDGTHNEESESFTVDLWPYFSPACCSGPYDCETGFYAVYHNLFMELSVSETTQKDEEAVAGKEEEAPCFNTADSTSTEVYAFYNYWTNFATKMSFSWEDKYNPADVPNRQVRRAIEKENKKFRDVGRKKYNETVRALASYIRKRDPRVMKFELEARARKEDDERKKIELKLEVESKRREKRELSRIALENNGEEVLRRQQERQGAFLLADNESDEEDEYDELAEGDIEDIKANADYAKLNIDEKASEQPDEHDDDDDKCDVCEVCSKTFKTEAQLLQHLASKNHRKKAQEMEKKSKKSGSGTAKKAAGEKLKGNQKQRAVEILCPSSDSESDSDKDDSHSAEIIEESTSKNKKKNKKDMKKAAPFLASTDFGSDSEESDSSSVEVAKKASIVDFATASLRSLNISNSEISSTTTGETVDVSTGEKQKNKYKKKEKIGYFPKAIIKESVVTLFPEDSLDPILHGEGVDVAIMPGPQKKKAKKISLRGF